jgi:phage terminase large subunit GpA-like protein
LRLANLIKPTPIEPPWKWAEMHRKLPGENAEPGVMRASRTPWVKDITEAVVDPAYPEVISVQGSQTGKTDGVLLNSIGRHLHWRHKPVLLYEPVEALADAMSDRINKMIASVPGLKDGLDRRRHSRHEMFIYSVRLGIGWGGSTAQTASHPAELICFDELDRCSDNAEGNPWQQTKARKATYPLGTHVGASSPTLGIIDEYKHPETGLYHWLYQPELEKVRSLCWQLWQEGTRGEYMLPCPECGQYFAPKGKLLLASIPQDASPEQAHEKAGMTCPHCGSVIHVRHQHRMIQEGKMICPGQWVENGEIKGERPNTRIYSAHINGLCSPWESWSDRAFEYIRVLRSCDKGRLQSFVNTELGECFGEQGEAPRWQTIQEMAGGYRIGTVPEGVQTLVCGVDVQRYKIVAVVYGIKKVRGKLEFYLIQHFQLYGSTYEDDVWAKLSDVLDADYDGFPIYSTALDTGYNPSSKNITEADKNLAYEFCMQRKNVMAVKSSSVRLPFPYKASRIEVAKSGRIKRRGLQLWSVDSVEYKRRIYAALSLKRGDAGSWHFPSDATDQYFKELVAEQETDTGRFIAMGPNEVLDCSMLCMAQVDIHRLVHQLTETSTVPKSGKTTEIGTDAEHEKEAINHEAKKGKRTVTRVQQVQRKEWW